MDLGLSYFIEVYELTTCSRDKLRNRNTVLAVRPARTVFRLPGPEPAGYRDVPLKIRLC